jgi:hypothetical protein
MKLLKRICIILILSVITIIGGAITLYFYQYPFGDRTACLWFLGDALRAYAEDHSGWYPILNTNRIDSLIVVQNINTNRIDSLMVLAPKYLSDPRVLAGLSGNRNKILEGFRENRLIKDSDSSIQYRSGLRDDDNPKLALFWDNTIGINVSGRRMKLKARNVYFVNGEFKLVMVSEWKAFLEQQGKLAEAVMKSRNWASSAE